ncbi:MAG: type II toxin-antitoxin system RelE/ParE family toxin [Thermoanaerobaculia bacterium]
MRHEIVLSPQAVVDLKRLPAATRAEVRDQIELPLRHEPSKSSRSRIKKLRGLRRPQFRLRVGDVRVFYDVVEAEVQILTIVTKEQATAWLATSGVSE